MKKVLIKIARPIVKAVYVAVKAVRRVLHKAAALFARKTRRGALGASDIVNTKAAVGEGASRSKRVRGKRAKPLESIGAAPVIKPQTRSKQKKIWWKDKYVIAGGGALAVALALILAFTLPGAGAAENDEAGQEALKSSAGQEVSMDDADSGDASAFVQSDTTANAASLVSTTQLPEPQPLPTPTLGPIETTAPDQLEIEPGCHDVRVVEIQERLMELGYMNEDEPSDYYGPVTQYALQLFQRKHYLQVDGIWGEATAEMLFSDEAKPYTVKLGDEGTDITYLQNRLRDLKYLKSKADGKFGEATETAVINFQKRNGLYADGNVGGQTRAILFSDNARPASTATSSPGGSSGPVAVGDPDKASADALVDYALTLLGKKYVLGGKGPDVFDCSGFVYYCLNRVGYKIGYMTSSGWASCSLPRVEKMSDMKKGDIICFKGHVGIYMGNDMMVDASSSNGCIVTRTNISKSSYWTRNFICARRVF